ncbi:MAG: excinuclease ABC subunit A, partial [Coprobacillus cateniformis]
HKKISQIIQSFIDIGLGYISLGQSSLTLSGGEAQRIKLAAELQMPNPQHTLYLLDEPSTGLHISDIQKLINIFDRLISKGHTIILVEHHLDVIKNADWIIDMGPEGGEKGGNVNVQGTVYDVQQCSQSYTGQLLKQCYIDENI